MLYVIIVLSFITICLLVRFLWLKKEIRSVTKQLQERHIKQTTKKSIFAFMIKILNG